MLQYGYYCKYILMSAVSILCMLMAGCNLMHPAPTTDAQRYNLNYSFIKAVAGKSSPYTILVMPTQYDPALKDKEMIYVAKPHKVSHFSKNEWVAPPPKMLTSLITKALQDSRHFSAIVATPFSGKTDLRLYTHLYQLQQEFLHKPSLVRVSMSAQLINVRTGKVIAAKQFQVVNYAPKNNPYSGVLAANRAVNKLMQELVRFCVKSVL